MNKVIVLLSWLLLIFSSAVAQSPGWSNYTPGAWVGALLDDGEAMWVGNIGGLVRINRITGEQTFFNKANTSLPDNYITCMASDQQGHIWVGTYWGGIFEFDGTTLCAVYNTDNSPLTDNHIAAIAVDDSNRIWISMYKENLAVLDGEDWTVYTWEDFRSLYLGPRDLTIDATGAVWVVIMNTPVRFDGKEWVTHEFDTGVNTMATDKQGLLWAFINKEGLGEYDGNEWTIYPVPDSLSDKQVVSLAVDSFGTKWMASWGNALISFDGNTWTQYCTKNSDIPSDTLLSVAVDADGCIWVGTTEKGVGRFDGKEWTLFSASNSKLPKEDITAIASDQYRNHWIGARGGGLIRFDEQEWEVYTRSNSGLPSDSIQSLYSDSDNNLWIGTYTSGVAIFDGSTWAVYDTSNSDLPSNEIRDIAADSEGNIWLITPNRLMEFDGQDWTEYEHPPVEQRNIKFFTLVVDGQDFKWVGSDDPSYYKGIGLSCFDGTNWTNYNENNSDLPNSNIRGIAIDSQDHKWITTGYGLAEFDNDNWTVYKSADSGLPYNSITYIKIDQFDRKWFGIFGARGIGRFDGSEWMQFIGPESPLSGYFVYAIDIDGENRVWIGAKEVFSAGLTVYDGDQIQGVQPSIVAQPDQLYLEQNYPNPFNPQTEIRYTLDQSGPVSLKVFDVAGREVQNLVKEVQSAGSYNITFDGAGLPSGVYFYQLRCGTECQVKKMLLLQ